MMCLMEGKKKALKNTNTRLKKKNKQKSLSIFSGILCLPFVPQTALEVSSKQVLTEDPVSPVLYLLLFQEAGMQSLKECCAEAFHPPVAESFALASRSPIHIEKRREENQVYFSP